MEFPDWLDSAAVLEFSSQGDFGTVLGDGRRVRHLAICQYPGEAGCYLFFCAGHHERYAVITDDLLESVEACKRSASRFEAVVWNQKGRGTAP